MKKILLVCLLVMLIAWIWILTLSLLWKPAFKKQKEETLLARLEETVLTVNLPTKMTEGDNFQLCWENGFCEETFNVSSQFAQFQMATYENTLPFGMEPLSPELIVIQYYPPEIYLYPVEVTRN